MSRWAACLLTGRTAELAALRLFANVEFAQVGGALWLRGGSLDDALKRELKKIPDLVRFSLEDSDRLRLIDSRIADRRLPQAAWRPLKEAVPVKLPTAALSGENAQRAPLSLIRARHEQPASALRIGLDEWHAFATNAPLMRLKPLRFAAMEDREVLALGTPLPGIPGKRFTETSGVLAPCGFAWSPPVDPQVLRQLFKLGEGDVVMLTEDNTHQIIRSEQFVPASRSAARNTLAEWPHA